MPARTDLEGPGAPGAAAPEPGAAADDEPPFRTLLRDLYLTFDRRTLALTRLVLGALLLFDLGHRAPDWLAMFSNRGVLPAHVMLSRPQSDGFTLFTAFTTDGELWALFLVGLAAYTCLFVGFQTKAAQVVSLIYVTSLNGRVLLIENGGYVVQNLLLLWTCFLPLGDRFSVDALRASMRRTREATDADLNDRAGLVDPRRASGHVSLVGAVIVLQLAAIYYFNVLHKTGVPWKNGTAVHFVLYNDRMVTPLFANLRDYAPNWLILVLTKGTLVMEMSIAIAVVNPLYRVWSRRAVLGLMNALQLGFGSVFTLGPFAWSACTFSTLMVSREDWELAERLMRRPHRARTVLHDRGSPAAFQACRLLRRLDGLELLTFQAVDEGGLATLDPTTGRTATGALAFADVLAALPGGPIVAWLPRLPGVRQALDALLERAGRLEVSRLLGLRAPTPTPPLPEPSWLARAADLGLTGLREALVLVMFAGALNQAAVELWVMKRFGFTQSPTMALLSHRMRFLQGWFMFSPNPVMDDGTLVVDALTADGRHVDPFTDKPPDWDLPNARSLRLNQAWGDYYARIRSNPAYHEAMREYLFRLPERTGRAEDELVSGEVYWLQDVNPAWGQTRSTGFEKVQILTFDKNGVHPTRPAKAVRE